MKKVLLLAASVIFFIDADAQTPAASPIIGGNVIKVNVSSSIATSHYMLQYERALNLNRSIGLGIGVSSGVELPFKSYLLDQYGDNEDARRAIETTEFDKLTITPEYRFYVNKKGAPIGFYVATFARYTKLSFTQDYSFTSSNNKEHFAKITGTLNGVGAGAMLGIQWALGEVFTLDWWIVGPFAGIQSGDFDGTTESVMTPEEQVEIKADIEDTDIPLWDIEATVGAQDINAKISGPFVGVRMFGLCLGFRF